MLDITALDHSIMSPPVSSLDTPTGLGSRLVAAATGKDAHLPSSDVVDVPPWDFYDYDFDSLDFDVDIDNEDDEIDPTPRPSMAWVN